MSAMFDKTGRKTNSSEIVSDLSMEDTGRLMTASSSVVRKKRMLLMIASALLIVAVGVGGLSFIMEKKYNDQISIAEKCLQEGDYAGAEAGYAAAVSMKKREEKGHKGLAYTFVLEGKYEEARDTYTQLYEMTNDEVYKTAEEETSKGMTPTDPDLFPSDNLWIKSSENRVYDTDGMFHFIGMFLGWSASFAPYDQTEKPLDYYNYDNSEPEQSFAFPISFAYFTYNDKYNIYPEYAGAYNSANSSNGGPDPRGWSQGGLYQRIEQEALDRVFSELFNVDKKEIPDVLAEMERRGIMYLEGGYYYEFHRPRGGLGTDCRVKNLYVNNAKCFIEYDLFVSSESSEEETYSDTFYAIMQLKEINGTRQWTMLYHGKDIPDELKEIVSSGGETEIGDSGDMNVLKEIDGIKLILTSGAGGWDNTMAVSADGRFRGVFHDSNSGDDLAPNLYCSYEGQIGSIEKISDYEYDLIIKGDLKLDEQHGRTEMRDGAVTEYCDPYGLENIKDGSRIRLLMPGYQTSGLSESAQSWIRMRGDDLTSNLNRYAIYNQTQETEYLFLQ